MKAISKLILSKIQALQGHTFYVNT